MTDNEILQLIRDDPKKGHRELFDTYYNYVCAVVTNILRSTASPEDIDECIIDVFASVIPRIEASTESNIKAYIGTAAKHRAISMQRSLISGNSKVVPDGEDMLSELPSGEDIAENAEKNAAAQVLLREVAALGEPDSTIIIQKYFYCRNSREIAGMVGMTPPAVRLRCSRALKKLRNRLKGEIL